MQSITEEGGEKERDCVLEMARKPTTVSSEAAHTKTPSPHV